MDQWGPRAKMVSLALKDHLVLKAGLDVTAPKGTRENLGSATVCPFILAMADLELQEHTSTHRSKGLRDPQDLQVLLDLQDLKVLKEYRDLRTFSIDPLKMVGRWMVMRPVSAAAPRGLLEYQARLEPRERREIRASRESLSWIAVTNVWKDCRRSRQHNHTMTDQEPLVSRGHLDHLDSGESQGAQETEVHQECQETWDPQDSQVPQAHLVHRDSKERRGQTDSLG